MDNDYKSRTGQSEIPVQADDKPVEDPIDPETADSDEQLGKARDCFGARIKSDICIARDENEAIDKSNIISGRTRGAKPSGTYTEPGDEEGLPGRGDSGSSAVAGGTT